MRAFLIIVKLIALSACAGPDTTRQEAAPNQPVCIGSVKPEITGLGVGGVRVHDLATEIRSMCPVIGDTMLLLEGQQQPALLIDVTGDTIVAEVAAERISRIRVVTPGLMTRDSLRVGTPLSRLARLPGAGLAAGEGQYFLISPDHCGLSFGIEGLAPGGKRFTTAELRAQPDSARVQTILIVGACHVSGRLRLLWEEAAPR
jgi:hypothetical protein